MDIIVSNTQYIEGCCLICIVHNQGWCKRDWNTTCWKYTTHNESKCCIYVEHLFGLLLSDACCTRDNSIGFGIFAVLLASLFGIVLK